MQHEDDVKESTDAKRAVDTRPTNESQVPARVRLVIVLFYPQDNTLEMIESKETACPGVGRSFALRRPSRVSLDDIRVGADVLVSGVGHAKRRSLKY